MKLPLGYRYSALYAGIRKTAKADVALIVSDLPATAAAVFTTNLVQAAPVKLARNNLEASGGVVRAVLVNAGNANCATRTGDKVALATTKALAKGLKCPASHIFPASTGVIGVEMEANKIVEAVPELISGLRADGFDHAADAILTTDLVRKTASTEVDGIRIAGMTKGSGMIHPNMATTLAFVMTDAAVTAASLRVILKRAVERSYNRLSVDGDMSTNDTLLVMANGASGKRVTQTNRAIFEEALAEVCESLARQIAADGEGAKRLVEIQVSGARDNESAARIARAIANSPLVKTAVAGADPNWGRILSSAGASGAQFDPDTVDIWLQSVRVCRRGLAAQYDEDALTRKLRGREIDMRFEIAGNGSGKARFWTCDLTEGYIKINGSYRT
ncbi:MAG TPA: bifunctional glutamate N-acetyltransferase/amino-acid acetyltransferase ArgJ [Bryobacteraceae bacterium]|nr:bifunctional glutamate N-acetyltransferase/amino-acid acetyltransferase ArgJ [Bryobacteraceae bacterium]